MERYQHGLTKKKKLFKILYRCSRDRNFDVFLTGKAPFPAVVDMFGSVGGLVEIRAALLASRGFLTLALPYFSYKDLPSSTDWLYTVKILDYFKVFMYVHIFALKTSAMLMHKLYFRKCRFHSYIFVEIIVFINTILIDKIYRFIFFLCRKLFRG